MGLSFFVLEKWAKVKIKDKMTRREKDKEEGRKGKRCRPVDPGLNS